MLIVIPVPSSTWAEVSRSWIPRWDGPKWAAQAALTASTFADVVLGAVVHELADDGDPGPAAGQMLDGADDALDDPIGALTAVEVVLAHPQHGVAPLQILPAEREERLPVDGNRAALDGTGEDDAVLYPLHHRVHSGDPPGEGLEEVGGQVQLVGSSVTVPAAGR